MTETRLRVNQLAVSFATDEGRVNAVADVSFKVDAGKTTALVGESGSGKSVTSLALMRLLAASAKTQVHGQAHYTRANGEAVDLLQLPMGLMRDLRGNEIAMIFQEPMTCLNPVLTIGEQIGESLRRHKKIDHRAAQAATQRMLERVEIPAAAQRMAEYPHQLSGGMRQRVMIALAMACEPRLLIADEPTTALDVTIQAQILELMRRLQADSGMSILFITHNLSVVAQHADDVAVMYAGRIVETASVGALFDKPCHPYTQALLDCLPSRQSAQPSVGGLRRLKAIRGQMASALNPPPGCAFEPRCDHAIAACSRAVPPLMASRAGGLTRCVLGDQVVLS